MVTELITDDTIDKYIKQIEYNIGVDLTQLKSDMVKYENVDKLSFIKDTQTKLDTLIKADKKLQEISIKLNDDVLYGDAKDKWNKMLQNVSKLQALSLINKTPDCKETTNAIIDALDAKLKAVNDVIQENLQQQGGNIKSYKHKYLKYKSKYLRIKNNI
jgi:hypothetical protein